MSEPTAAAKRAAEALYKTGRLRSFEITPATAIIDAEVRPLVDALEQARRDLENLQNVDMETDDAGSHAMFECSMSAMRNIEAALVRSK